MGAACFPGALVLEGGFQDGVSILAGASRTRGADYQYVCWDATEVARRKALAEKQARSKTPKKASGIVLGPPVRYVEPEAYGGECTRQGQHSIFFFLNFFPATATLNPEYAIGRAVQELEGDTMINIRMWHETHYYSILGRAEVIKVRGDVIRFKNRAGREKTDKKKKEKGAQSKKSKGGRRR